MFKLPKSLSFMGVLLTFSVSSSLAATSVHAETTGSTLSESEFSRPFFSNGQSNSANETATLKSTATKGGKPGTSSNSSSSFRQDSKHFPRRTDKTVYDRYQPVIQKVKGSK
ncbi:MAG: hypothetical protein PHC51_08640 [bacterium]|nr:hypothetical protein [bacterium]